MKFQLSCQDATRLVLEGEDRALGMTERLRLRLHMAICQACPRFVRQAAFMRQAMGRWKQYAENPESGHDDQGSPGTAPPQR